MTAVSNVMEGVRAQRSRVENILAHIFCANSSQSAERGYNRVVILSIDIGVQ